MPCAAGDPPYASRVAALVGTLADEPSIASTCMPCQVGASPSAYTRRAWWRMSMPIASGFSFSRCLR